MLTGIYIYTYAYIHMHTYIHTYTCKIKYAIKCKFCSSYAKYAKYAPPLCNQAGPSGAASAISAPAESDAPPCLTISTLPPEPCFPSRRSESLEHRHECPLTASGLRVRGPGSTIMYNAYIYIISLSSSVRPSRRMDQGLSPLSLSRLSLALSL